MIKPSLVKFQIKFKLIKRLFIALIALSLSLSLFRNIARMRQAKSRLQKANQTLASLKKDQQVLGQELSDVKTQVFLEKQARDQLGLVKEGEAVLVLPDEEILKKLSPRQHTNNTPTLPVPTWRQWFNLFL